MEQDKYSFFTKQFDSWRDFEKEFENWCINNYQPVNIKRSSMKYNDKLMEEFLYCCIIVLIYLHFICI
jgi:hypothetical protein